MLPHSQFRTLPFSPPVQGSTASIFDSSLEPHHDGPASRHAAIRISSNDWADHVVENTAVGQQAPHGAETGVQIHSDSSPEYPNDSASQPQPSKRARTESSRIQKSYPRKRAVTACQLCRVRKTKCSNTRPTCKFCADAKAVCVYEDPLDHSSYVLIRVCWGWRLLKLIFSGLTLPAS
jgi:Fungal Zn(2)-Cys(6) binuclear cluster domain